MLLKCHIVEENMTVTAVRVTASGRWRESVIRPGRGGMCSGCASLIRPIKSCQRFWSTVSNAVPYDNTICYINYYW